MDPMAANRWLLRCISDNANAASGAAEPQGPEWEQIARLAGRHGIAPLLYDRLRASSLAPSVPADVMATLCDAYLASAGRAFHLYRSLSAVLPALQRAGIAVIALKGVHLATSVYASPALRPMSDIDLLARPDDVQAIEELLLGLGYTSHEHNGTTIADANADLVYMSPGQGMPIEVHWTIQEQGCPFEIASSGLWHRATSTKIAGAQVHILSPEDLLLHLCTHAGFRHLFTWNGVRSLVDIAQTIQRFAQDMRWPDVEQRAQEWRATHVVFVMLQLAQRMVGAQVPDHVLRALQPADFDPVYLDWAEQRILLASDLGDGVTSDGWGQVWSSRRPQEKIRAAVRACFPARQTLASKYSVPATSPRLYLLYPVHLLDLLRRHAVRALRLACGDRQTKDWVQSEAARYKVVTWLSAG